jgi:2-hydroxychromene-2-carboxylate isomerase
MAGSSTADTPAFYFDLRSPEAYLAAERVIQTLPVATEWIPVASSRLPAADTLEGWRCETDREAFFDRMARAAARRGLQPLRWPQPFPFDSMFALHAATYAKQIGRTVPFALAAFRQAFAGGSDLSVADNVLVAAAACEMHPAAVLKAAALASIAARLDDATALAARRGVRDVPAVWLPSGEVFHGDEGLDEAASALAPAVHATEPAPGAGVPGCENPPGLRKRGPGELPSRA